MANTFPRGDAQFIEKTGQFFDYVDANQAALGFSAGFISNLKNLRDPFVAAYGTAQNLENQKQSAVADKDTKRDTMEPEYNAAAAQMKANPLVTAAQIEESGLDAPDEEPTPIGAPTTRPIGSAETAQRLEHRIKFVDETSPTTGSTGKPEGVASCFIFRKIGGAPPIDINECQFVAQDTASPYLATYTGVDAGKTVYYILRWANPKGEMGPISETVAATVTG
jgi:hypothetical protein